MNIRTFVAILSRNPQYDFPKMRGGESKAVWNFSEVSSVLETPSVPYGDDDYDGGDAGDADQEKRTLRRGRSSQR